MCETINRFFLYIIPKAMSILFFVFYSFAILYVFFIGYSVIQPIKIGNFVLKEVVSNFMGFISIYFSLFFLNGYYLNSLVNERTVVTTLTVFFTIFAGIRKFYQKIRFKVPALVMTAVASLSLIIIAVIESMVGGVWS